MSDTEQESLTERELAEEFASTIYSGKPRSVGEALAAADEAASEPVVDEPTPVVDEPPIVVEDEPVQDTPAPVTEGELEEVPAEEAVPGEEEGDTSEADPNVIWAKKKYGEDVPPKAARALYEQEQMISRQATKMKDLEDWQQQAQEYIEYAEQQVQQSQPQLPLSAQEEMWADQSLQNPVQYALQAALANNMPLYNAVIERIAMQDPRMASAVETEVRMALIGAAEEEAHQQNGGPDFYSVLADAVQRAGIDVPTYGQAMIDKISELGENSDYVQTIMGDNHEARRVALLAVYDMVRAGNLTTRTVRDEARDEKIRREAELRKQAAGVVTGGVTHNPPPKQSPFMEAMEAEWRQRGQWSEE